MGKFRPAYTFMEIITVVAIIAVISTVGVVSFRQGENNSNLELNAELLINVFRDLQIKAMNGVAYQDQQPAGGYGWVVNNFDPNGFSTSYSTFIRTQNIAGPYTAGLDTIISSTTVTTGFYLLPGGRLTLNFKPLTGLIEAYLDTGQKVASPLVGVAFVKIKDHYFKVLLNGQSGIITSEKVWQFFNWEGLGLL
ncbi:MAG: type II secretion system protein [Candidatus Komeilibacteria bacterium]|nr:type II secretion system protein [Candidatus Komeilibacteria bacterium]